MTTLSPVLSEHDLPLAELRAARLDGELWSLDECFVPVDQVESPLHRAMSISALWPDRIIAERATAAWIWGARPMPPRSHEFCARIGARVRPTKTGRSTIREVVIDDREITVLGGLRVTRPLRTVLDIARFAPAMDDEQRALIIRLMEIGRLTLADLESEVASRRNLPGKRRALERLRELSPS